jgi:hypothetical protein
LNQWCIPPLTLQVSDSSSFFIMCDVPSTVVFFVQNVLNAFAVPVPNSAEYKTEMLFTRPRISVLTPDLWRILLYNNDGMKASRRKFVILATLELAINELWMTGETGVPKHSKLSSCISLISNNSHIWIIYLGLGPLAFSDSEFDFWHVWIYFWKFDRTPLTGDQPVARSLPTEDSTTQQNANIHPCFEWDSNPRSQSSSCLR